MGVKVLGVDPGSRRTGFAVVEVVNNSYFVHTSGVIVPKSKDIYERIYEIFNAMSDVYTQFLPQEASIEKLFYHKNFDSVAKLSYARAACVLALMRFEAKVYEYAPLDIKKAVTGYGRASKEQVQQMVKVLTGVSGFKYEDESDAIAVAITHLNFRKFYNLD